jgi:hypothetical protein
MYYGDDGGFCQHACFYCMGGDVGPYRLELGFYKCRGRDMHGGYAGGILGGERCDYTHPIRTQHREGLEIGLYAGAATTVGARNRKDRGEKVH